MELYIIKQASCCELNGILLTITKHITYQICSFNNLNNRSYKKNSTTMYTINNTSHTMLTLVFSSFYIKGLAMLFRLVLIKEEVG